MDGGARVADVLAAQGTRFLFTLCGGHISPILVAAKARGIRVVDTRHEATAVFAADGVARLTGRPGVAAVTAGPGVTNTVTAIANARLAQSPLVLIGGAAPTVLRGRGALQDIDQSGVLEPLVKRAVRVRRVRDIVPALETAFRECQAGVPGPVFVELPVDVLYEEQVVRSWYGLAATPRSVAGRLVHSYLRLRVHELFSGASPDPGGRIEPAAPGPQPRRVAEAIRRLEAAQRPLLLVGSQALLSPQTTGTLVAALERIGAPVYLSGMARGVLGVRHPLQIRHGRREALRQADAVMLVGVPADFRLDYGRHIPGRATLLAANRDSATLRLNRTPDVAIRADPTLALAAMADQWAQDGSRWADWLADLRERDTERDLEIRAMSEQPSEGIHPIRLCQTVAEHLPPHTVVIGDGGDFVATAAQVVRPDGPLRWLDPGAFGTLGVGAGFAIAAALVHPENPVWVLFGDGAVGYSLIEFDTFARHNLAIKAVVGNDAAWSQIARDQIAMLQDDVATSLAPTPYDQAVTALGGIGFGVSEETELGPALAELVTTARPTLVNVDIGRTSFRQGSVSL